MLSVAVDVAGGQSVRNMSVLRTWSDVVAPVRVVVVAVARRRLRPLNMLFLLLLLL